jgi:hypothetical protein
MLRKLGTYLSLGARRGRDVDEATSVLLALVGATLGCLGSFGLLDLSSSDEGQHVPMPGMRECAPDGR